VPKGFDPILPKKPITGVTAATETRLMSAFSNGLKRMLKECQEYEAPSTYSKSGVYTRSFSGGSVRAYKRATGYRRTNTLRRSWSMWGPKRSGRDIVGEVVSRGQMAPYNVYVKGPTEGPGTHQAEKMASRGWRSITEIVDTEWPKIRRELDHILTGG
jgi:hypothetical protein